MFGIGTLNSLKNYWRARVCACPRAPDPPTHQSALSHNKWKMYRTWKHWMGMKFRLQLTHISLSLCLCFLWQCILQDFSFTFKLNLLSYIKVINSVDHTLVVHNAIRNERRREMLPLFHYRHFQIATVYMCVLHMNIISRTNVCYWEILYEWIGRSRTL